MTNNKMYCETEEHKDYIAYLIEQFNRMYARDGTIVYLFMYWFINLFND